MKEESLLLLSDLQKLINQVVLIDYTIIILGGEPVRKGKCFRARDKRKGKILRLYKPANLSNIHIKRKKSYLISRRVITYGI